MRQATGDEHEEARLTSFEMLEDTSVPTRAMVSANTFVVRTSAS